MARLRAGYDWEEGRWLLYAFRSSTHHKLGYGSFGEYVGRLFGYKTRSIEEKLRVAEALERLPALEEALRSGMLNWSTVRELTRVATPENENEWLDASRGRTVREIEECVSGRSLGDGPGDPPTPGTRRHVLRFEVRAETLALFRELQAKLCREAGEHLDDDALLLLLARSLLGRSQVVGSVKVTDGSSVPEGAEHEQKCETAPVSRANYQIALSVCDQCGRGFQQANGERIEVSSEIVEMFSCDAEFIGRVPARPRAHVGAVAGAAHVGAVAGAAHVDAMAGAAHVGACRPSPTRAKQSIPPSVRRLVLRRDDGRCVAPGCTHAVFVDVHHLHPRAEGGNHDPDFLVTLCGAHHRAVHLGRLHIEGCVSAGLRFQHADGSAYGDRVSPDMAEIHAQTFQALRRLGFGETESRRALRRASAEGSAHGGASSREQLLRAALAVLTPMPLAG